MPEKPNDKSIDSISPAELEELIRMSDNRLLDLSHLTQLDADTASRIKNFRGNLYLNGITHLDVATALLLSEFQCDTLHLNGLTHLDVPVAEILTKSPSYLSLDGLTHLDPALAEILVRHRGKILNLNGLTKINPTLAEILGRYEGNLYLGGLTNLDPASAKHLVKLTEGLSFNGLGQLDAEVVRCFKGFQGELYFEGLTDINTDIAELLINSSRRGEIHFKCLTHLGPAVAKVLAKYSGNNTIFDVLGKIGRDAIEALMPLWRRGTLVVSDEVADCFVEVDLTLGYGNGQLDLNSDSRLTQWQPLFEKEPNFKYTVMEEGAEISQYLRENGVENPERFHNLNAGKGAEKVIDEALEYIKSQPNGFGLTAFNEMFSNRVKKDFESNPVFLAVYLDETLQAIADHLNKIILSSQRELGTCDGSRVTRTAVVLQERIDDPQLPDKIKKRFRQDLKKLLSKDVGEKSVEMEKRIKNAQELLSRMASFHLKRSGEVSYQLASRSTCDLTLGDKCSDCTSAKIHGMNFWTVPTWLTDPGFNFLLQYDEEGRLAHKFGLVWELKIVRGKQVPILTIDSLELANQQKVKPGMSEGPADEVKEERLMDEAMAFVRGWAEDMGLDSRALYSSTASNTGTMELDAKYPTRGVSITKLGALDAPRRILKKTNPDYEGEVKVYLQSLIGSEEQAGGNQNDAEGEAVNEVALEDGDRAKDFAQVESSIDQFLRSDSEDKDKVRSILELARTDAEAAARQMRIFLVTQAHEQTKEALAVEGKRIDIFLHSRGHSLESYLKSILGQTEVTRGMFIKTHLLHLIPKDK